MKRQEYFACAVCFILILGVCSALAADPTPTYSPEMAMAREAMGRALSEIGLQKGDENLLVLTNAGYGQIGSQTSEAFLDIARETTGCSVGTRSLLAVHKSVNDPLWCSIFRKDTRKLIFLKWTGQGFAQQVLDASPEKILTPEGWKIAAAGLIGQNIFSVVSISLTWEARPPWPLLLAATFHDHFCPGVNAGYVVAEYCRDKMALGPGEQYLFVTAPAICPADALQVMFNTTAGKNSGYAMSIAPANLAKYEKDKVQPMTIAMRVNRKADTCEGIVLGFNWNKVYRDTGVRAEEIAPPGGSNDPMFWIARVKASRGLARLSREQLLGYIVELKKFSGKASLANEIVGGDPYAQVWNR
ncbi:MAG TPA: FmdE family protein [Thermodesulfobacteriota bacterium]|nr:FmdE family protein [Thermodesulfobacteriota bacterium]